MDYYIGFQVEPGSPDDSIFLHQRRYITDIIGRFGMEDCHPIATPSDSLNILTKCAGAHDLEFHGPYKEAIGCLMYAMVMTTPDIAFAISKVSRYCNKPRQSHWSHVKRIFRYLKGTTNYGILFYSNPTHLTLVGYTDADYAGDLDDRKSRTGYTYKLANGPISWCSQRQTCTVDSTTESEFVAHSESVKEAIWLHRLLESIGIIQNIPTVIHCDNQSALSNQTGEKSSVPQTY